MHEFVFASADFLQDPMLSATCGGCTHGASLLNDDLREMINMVLEIIRLMSEKRHRGDSNPMRAEPNGFRVHLLNRSDTVSVIKWNDRILS
jgi:phage gp46-like protein